MLHNEIEYLIRVSGEEHDREVIEYGMIILEDTLFTSLAILLLGTVFDFIIESIIFLIMSMTGTSTFGGVSL